MMHDSLDALSTATSLAADHRAGTDDDHKATWGQYFTSEPVARFMAGLLPSAPGRELTILDPGAGAGILGIAAARSLIDGGAVSVHLVAVEAEETVRAALRAALEAAALQLGARFRFTLWGEDFLALHHSPIGVEPLPLFDAVIANPPYFKMSPTQAHGGVAPNAYARFMEVAATMLRPGGDLVFIIPRSFASGFYFQRFRREFHETMRLRRAHVFDSRRDAFGADGVLQENIVVAYQRGGSPGSTIRVSSSAGVGDLAQAIDFEVPVELVIRPKDPHGVVYLPTCERDVSTMRTVLGWRSSLRQLGLEISTGPVVPFRTESLAREAGADTVPMLWMQHVRHAELRWPLGAAFRKCEHIRVRSGSKLLVPNRTYVLLRRFSAKEEARRLTIAVLDAGALPGTVVGLENHLNFIHVPDGVLDSEVAYGLAALLGSALVDDFFRIQSGNTQVSATEIRALPLPSEAALRALGRQARAGGDAVLADPVALDALVRSLPAD